MVWETMYDCLVLEARVLNNVHLGAYWCDFQRQVVLLFPSLKYKKRRMFLAKISTFSGKIPFQTKIIKHTVGGLPTSQPKLRCLQI